MGETQAVEEEIQVTERRLQTLKQESSERKAKEVLSQLEVIKKIADTLQEEVEKLVSRKLDPNSDVGRIVRDLQRLQGVLQRDLTNLDFTVKEQGGFRTWAEGLLSKRS